MFHSTRSSGGGRGFPDHGDGEERYLATRAAWLYYNSGLKQAEVAQALGVSLNKANRLLAAAQESGVVRVTVEGPIAGCVGLEDEIRRRFGLDLARVVPELSGSETEAVGRAAATVLVRAVREGRHRVFGIGRGRMLAAIAPFIPALPECAPGTGVEFVSLLGCPPVSEPTRQPELVRVLGERSGTGVRLLPAPIYARDPADIAVITRQPGVQEGLDAAQRATMLMSGIGDVAETGELMVRCGVLTAAEVAGVREAGAVSVFLGYFLDAQGKPAATELNRRLMSLSLETIARRDTIGIAGGPVDDEALLSVLRSGLLRGLVTTETRARRLLSSA